MSKFRPVSLLSLPLVFSLSACGGGNGSAKEKAQVLFGTQEYVSSEVSPLSHMKKIEDESLLEQKIRGQEDFVLIVIGRGESGSHETCSCWGGFHSRNIVPFQREFRFLFYYMYSDELSDSRGLKLGVGKATIGVFLGGELRYQNSDEDESAPFYSSYEAFKTWMLSRVSLPRVYFVSKTQLDELYAGSQEFTIYYSRQTCSDCLYLQRGLYKEWYVSHSSGVEDSYIIDCDGVGIASVKDEEGKIHNRNEDSEWGKKAAEQYASFKREYGLSWSEQNPAGYQEGVFPTLYHVNPDGVNKTGDVIDASGIFFNETLENGKVRQSYFDGSRDELECFSYLEKVERKSLVGLEVENTREALVPYVKPLLNAFLDYAVGEAK